MTARRTRHLAVTLVLLLVASLSLGASTSPVTASAASTPPAHEPAVKKSATKKANRCASLTIKQRSLLKRQLKGKKLTNKRCLRKVHALRSAARAAKTKPTPKPTQTTTPSSASTTVFGMSANGEAALQAAEATIGVKAGIVGVFADFTDPFPTEDASHAAARGAALMISWEPWNWEIKSQTQPDYTLDKIVDGTYDSYIRTFAQAAAATARPVFVRFAAEMNGDWHVWSTGFNGNGPGDYVAAHRHVVDVARAAGGTNIKWVFNPIVSYDGSTPLTQLYPGDSYVDWVALDGYNWGSLKWGWQPFTDIFTAGLKELKAISPNKPLAIAEIGSTPGAGKAAWITDSFARARAAGARMMIWFEHNKETDWRLSENTYTASAAQTAATAPGWVSGGDYAKVKTVLGL